MRIQPQSGTHHQAQRPFQEREKRRHDNWDIGVYDGVSKKGTPSYLPKHSTKRTAVTTTRCTSLFVPRPKETLAVHNSTRKPQLRKQRDMVIGLLVIAGIPTTIGVCEALSAQKKANNAAKEKAKFHLTASISLDGGPPEECFCVLRDGRVSLVPVTCQLSSRLRMEKNDINPPLRIPTRYPRLTPLDSYGSTIPTIPCLATSLWGTTSHIPLKRSIWAW